MSQKEYPWRDKEWLARRIESGKRPYTIANELGTNESVIRKWKDIYNINHPFESKELMKEAVEEGLTPQEMAEEWGEKVAHVVVNLEQKGLR